MEERIFTINEVIEYLKIPKSTIYKLCQKKEIPYSKIGKQLRFRKSSLDRWLTEKETGYRNQIYQPLKIDEISKQRQKCILLVDDDRLVLKTISNFLRGNGFQVEPAESGEEALEKIGKKDFDLIIADIRMPGIDGIETIKRIRKFYSQSNKPSVPEIAITGYIDTDTERQAQSLGIRDYLYKPFSISDFINRVKDRLEAFS